MKNQGVFDFSIEWKELLFSHALSRKNRSHKIAYIAIMTAFTVVANMFFEFKLAETQFSLTLAVSCLTGIVIGPLFGFVACFLGDLVGFFYHSGGYAYYPWIGFAMGMSALIAGFVVNGTKTKGMLGLCIKLSLTAVLTFLICSVAINTTAFWLLYAKGVDFWTYFISRFFIQGQIYNSLVNYALLFVFVPLLQKIKPLKLNFYGSAEKKEEEESEETAEETV